MSCPCHVPQVQYMHDQGVIHRDLKLENVLLNHADDCKASTRLHTLRLLPHYPAAPQHIAVAHTPAAPRSRTLLQLHTQVCDFGLAHLFRRERGKIVRRSTRAAQKAHLPQALSGASNYIGARAAHGDLRLKVVRRT